MPNVSFTQYRNELARVLGTRQRSGRSVSSKSISVSAAGAESEEEEEHPVSKSQHKQEKKISAQSSQIKDLCTKLDGAIAREYTDSGIAEVHLLYRLAFTNALQPTHFKSYRSGGKFLGKK